MRRSRSGSRRRSRVEIRRSARCSRAAAVARHGFACGQVLATRELPDRVLSTVELSRACHLRWSQPELVAPPPRAEMRRKVMLVGPTCYEEDAIGEWTVEPAHVATRVVLRNITGY